MLTLHRDILEETVGIIVHGVNAQGKFGAGFAKELAKKYPQVKEDYLHRFNTKGLILGDAILTKISPVLYIVSGVTQKYYGRDKSVVYVDYDAVSEIFRKISWLANTTSLPVKFPMIGCGLANGDWNIVSGIIESRLYPMIERTLFTVD